MLTSSDSVVITCQKKIIEPELPRSAISIDPIRYYERINRIRVISDNGTLWNAHIPIHFFYSPSANKLYDRFDKIILCVRVQPSIFQFAFG